MPHVRVERFNVKDLDHVLSLWNQVFKGREYFHPMNLERFESMVLNNPNFDPRGCFVAKRSSEIAGFGLGVVRARKGFKVDVSKLSGFVSILFVHPNHRKKGIGTRLLKEIERFLKLRGKGEAQIGYPYNPISFASGMEVSEHALKFFINRGYRIVAESLLMHRKLRSFKLREKIKGFMERHEKIGITYRMCTEKERSALLQFMELFPGWYDRVSASFRSTSPKPILIAICGEKVVGFVGPISVDAEGEGHFTGIGVHPEYRRMKIGTVLFNLLCFELKKRGATCVKLHTGTANPAQEIYFDAGFKVKSIWATQMTKKLKTS